MAPGRFKSNVRRINTLHILSSSVLDLVKTVVGNVPADSVRKTFQRLKILLCLSALMLNPKIDEDSDRDTTKFSVGKK